MRALAVLPVVLFHIDPGLMPGGFLGVDVFFVISGYLISTILYREQAQGNFSLSSFYGRRVRRLFPALLLVLAVVLGFGYFALFADEYQRVGKDAFFAILFLLDFRLMRETGYFDVATYGKPLLHLWSLSVEEQFYLVWPVLLLLLGRMGFRLRPLLMLGAAGSLALAQFYGEIAPEAVYYHPGARFWELLIGAVIAHWQFGAGRPACFVRVRNGLVVHGLSLAGLVLVVSSLVLFDRSFRHPGLITLWPIVGVALLIGSDRQALANRLLAWRPLVGIGLISYPLYLWHWPMLAYVRIIDSGRPAAWSLWGTAGLSVLFAWLTYRFCERPIREARTQPVVVWALSSAMVGLALVPIAIDVGLGWPDRPALQYVKPFASDLVRQPAQDPVCLRRFPSSPAPVYCREHATGARMLAIIGDSHAHVLFPGVSVLAEQRGLGTLLLANSGCPPMLGTTLGRTDALRAECVRDIGRVIQPVLTDPRISDVLIATRGPIYMDGTGYGVAEDKVALLPIAQENPSRDLGNVSLDDIFGRGLLETAYLLNKAGKRVYYLLQVPELSLTARDCLGRPLTWTYAVDDCVTARAAYETRMRRYRAIVAEVAKQAPYLGVIDVQDQFCDAFVCSARRQRELLYFDNNHLSISGSRLVAPAIVEQILGTAVIR